MIKFNVVDRRTYIHKGSWTNPNQDLTTPIFYYFIQPLTMALQMRQGREVIKPTATIGVYGEHHFVKGDVITLHDGMQLQVVEQSFIYREGNIKVRHMLKSRVQETSVVLE
jgi:hypothetical protein